MKITDLSNDINEWFNGSGPMSDIVISSRIRLARNVAGYKFLCRCSSEDKLQILNNLKDAIMSLDLGENIFYISIDKSTPLDRSLLVERHLISRNHAFGKGPRGAIISVRESFTAMINEEDHLRLQVIRGGLRLKECFDTINKIDDDLEQKISYAFSTKYGYLTACPTNIGTGIRVSVMLHLPALKMTNQTEKLFNAAKSMNLAVRGLFGEGTEATGDFYQISNQMTLGIEEEKIVLDFEKNIIPQIVEYEIAARKHLLEHDIDNLDDKISRAVALLNSAHLISSQEALFLLSHLRLGINMRNSMGASTPAIESLFRLKSENIDEPISIRKLNRLFMLTLPAHLQINHGMELDPTHRDALRAKIIRQILNQ
jgi:protein arginine kinase